MILAGILTTTAQNFFNLTADEVSVDTLLPRFSYSFPLPDNYADSVYTVEIVYPDFIDMSQRDINRYHAITTDTLPALPEIEQRVVVERKRGHLEVSFVPLVFREGKYQILVSFMLRLTAKPVPTMHRIQGITTTEPAMRYAQNSVLAEGRWAKIRVSTSGVYQLTEQLIKQAGFSSLSRVRIYGYGGALQNEQLVPEELIATDDLKEVATCIVDGRRLFYAQGPVSWSKKDEMKRTRNPYSDYGYYFLTESDGDPLAVDSAAFIHSFYPSPADYHSLHEVDGYSWFHGGRNLFENSAIEYGNNKQYILSNPSTDTKGRMAVAVTTGNNSTVRVLLNGKEIGTIVARLSDPKYDKGAEATKIFEVNNLSANDTVTIENISGSTARLDYIDIYTASPRKAPDLTSQTIPTPEFVYGITNQNLHAHTAADMIIIIPTSQKLRAQAQRIADMHEQRDSLRVRIVPADEIFNEFSSGTPDANAYRRYLKMLYDRAQTDADMPRYLLLFGDGVWDNRMLTSDCRNFSPDDFLLCFESENSFNEIHCYVDDGFYGLLDDDEGLNPKSSDKLDLAIGRFPVHNEEDAKTMVDKTINYAANIDAGSWQNVIMVMGDDGNGNSHMEDANKAAEVITSQHPGYIVKKVMWDAYTRETSATGNSYPGATKAIKAQQSSGALIMDYSGHGSQISISHERVLSLQDFQEFNNTHMPLWITASCDVSPFDDAATCIGMEAVLNKKGGALTFFGTTRTVYQHYNARINQAFIKHVLAINNGRRTTMGEAQRLAKNEMITSGQDLTDNKLQYSLLGDPALPLNVPTLSVVIDSIDGKAVATSQEITMRAGSTIWVKGHIERNAMKDISFNGLMTATVRDSEEKVICKGQADDTKSIYSYYDRQNVLFNGSDNVTNGEFAFSFAVPMDINYSSGKGLMNIYAVNDEHTLEAHGACDKFIVGGSDELDNDSIGPSIYCYLNTPSFSNGGDVNTTPYFVAQITDKDGINAAGTGIGHDLELIIDDEMARTYVLNDNFTFDFGSYTSGNTYYSIPSLTPGRHTLKFRAWDVLNNSSTATLSFNVVDALKPTLYSVSCTNNPATTSTTFIINHDRTGSNMDVEIDVFDVSGRQLWIHNETGVSTDGAYTVDWDLTIDGGRRLQTGVYLYRVRVACDGRAQVSKAKKLIVINNN